MKLAAVLLENHCQTHSWRQTCHALGIVNAEGQPDPGLALRITQGYEPRTAAVRIRIGLPPLPGTVTKPAWLRQAVRNLRRLESGSKINSNVLTKKESKT